MIEREESMVERVAKAIRDASTQDDWTRAAARAAIEAMREPDYEMCIKGQPAVNLSEECGKYEFLSREEISGIWRAMIDAALKEGS